MSDVRGVFGRNLRGVRQRQDPQLRQEDLAAQLDMGQSTVSDLERGKRDVTMVEVIQICRRLDDVSLADLLRGLDPDDLRALGL